MPTAAHWKTARFLSETAVSEAIGSDRVCVRRSPLNSMADNAPMGLTAFLAEKLNDFKLAYLHLMRADFFGVQKADVVTVARTNYKGVLIGNLGYRPQEAEQAIKDGNCMLWHSATHTLPIRTCRNA